MSDQVFEFDLEAELRRRRAANPANPANPDSETSEISSISNFSRGAAPKFEGSAIANNNHAQKGDCIKQPVEHWDVKRLSIPSQTKPGHVDVWMCARRTDGVQQIRLWYAGTEDSTHGSPKGDVDEPQA